MSVVNSALPGAPIYTSWLTPYQEGYPWTGDIVKMTRGLTFPPLWPTNQTMGRALCVTAGPFEDPEGRFTVSENDVLVLWEVKQVPAGSWQEENMGLRPVVHAILPINRTYVSPNSMLARAVNPDGDYLPGVEVAVLFPYIVPAECVGIYYGADEGPDYRDFSGSLLDELFP